MRATELFSDESEPPPLKTIVGRITVPVLLIASAAPTERAIDNAYRQRMGSRATLWYLADTPHTRGLATQPRAYAARVGDFLNAALDLQPH